MAGLGTPSLYALPSASFVTSSTASQKPISRDLSRLEVTLRQLPRADRPAFREQVSQLCHNLLQAIQKNTLEKSRSTLLFNKIIYECVQLQEVSLLSEVCSFACFQFF